MRKFLLICSVAMGVFASIQAAEEIPFQVNNTSWGFKTRLECCVEYPTIKEEFSLILEGTTSTKTVTTMHYTFPKGAIKSIKLDLTRYDETTKFDDTIETLIAELTFIPNAPSLRKITFTIEGNGIKPEAVYG